jgi:hypothetical protein
MVIYCDLMGLCVYAYIYIHIFSGNQKAMENHLEMEVLMGKSTMNHPLYIIYNIIFI